MYVTSLAWCLVVWTKNITGVIIIWLKGIILPSVALNYARPHNRQYLAGGEEEEEEEWRWDLFTEMQNSSKQVCFMGIQFLAPSEL